MRWLAFILLAWPLCGQDASITDVQAEVSAVLTGSGHLCDLNGDGNCDVLDVQILINAIVNAATGCTAEIVTWSECGMPLSDVCMPDGVQWREIVTECSIPPSETCWAVTSADGRSLLEGGPG